ncbi:MAG: hypothetical protein J1F12_05795 [Muribaculaceae bacterium]|nr:hypothetical protein [Muribaculaceae bacterium]
MKKFLALGLISICSAMTFAQDYVEPVVIPDATARKISQDGKWVGCHGTSIVIYNVETNKSEVYAECSLGNGNAIALSGLTVGSQEDYAALMKEGKLILPEIFVEAEFAGFNGITSDGSRLVGFVKNPVLIGDDETDPYDEGIIAYVPVYADIDPDGNIESYEVLPYPEKDFLGNVPQAVRGIWISNDGKTILASMTDSNGRMEDPIVYTQSENGDWEYTTPTKEFFNPEGIDIPENPWNNYPPQPKLTDYMNALQYQAYMKAWENYFLNGGPEVDPLQYMNEDKAEEYIKAYEEYENYFTEHLEEFNAYEKAYRELLQTSIYFGDTAMDPEGSFFATNGHYYDEEGTNAPSRVLISNIETGENKFIESKYSGLKIHQILSDGTIIAYTGLFTYDVLKGYILLPGESEFQPFSNYLATVNPKYAEWLEDMFPYGEGIINASENMAVIAGGLDILAVEDTRLFPESTIITYILPDVNGLAGVEAIEESPVDGVYKVYNLMGVKVLETKDKSEIKNIGKGIYIVNGKKIAL